VAAGDLLQALQALDVHLQRLAAGARPAPADRVRGLGEHRLDGADLHLVVMRLDGVHHVLGLAVPAGDLRADQRVASLDLVGERLADVVQHRAPLEQGRVHPQLTGHHPRDVRGLDQVAKHVLAVGGAVPQAAEEVDELRVHVGEAELDQRVLACPLAQLLDLRPAPLVGVLDPLGVDAAVQDEPLQGEPGDLPADRVEAGKEHGFRRVVDDEVDAGHRLEGPDVPAFAADDAALHLIAWQVEHRDNGLAGLLGGHPLDGERDDLPGALVTLGPGLVLDVPDDERRFPLGLVLDDGDQLGLGLLRGEARDPLQLPAARGFGPFQLGGTPVEILLALVEPVSAVLDAPELLVEALLAVGQAHLAAFQVAAQLPHLVLDRADLLLDLTAALGGLLGLVPCPAEDPRRLRLGAGQDVLGFLLQLAALARGAPGNGRGARGSAPHDHEREHRCEQPDHHERERQSAVHGHPFPS
jgi:hypothetical protein